MAKHILVVNDVEEVLELFEAILHEEAGYDVTVSTYKPDMFEWIKALKPDLIILDHRVGPDRVGWQLVDKLKMDRATSKIPIIVCSAAVQELREREDWLASRKFGLLCKPFEVDELLAIVARYV